MELKSILNKEVNKLQSMSAVLIGSIDKKYIKQIESTFATIF